MEKSKSNTKDKILRVRIDNDFYQKISEFIEADGSFNSVSDFVRYILDDSINKGKKKSFTSVIDNGLIYQLNRIGNNINQLAYQVNKAALKGEVDEALFKEVIEELVFSNTLLFELKK